MKTCATQHSSETRRAVLEPQQFPPLELETRPAVGTEQAAYYFDRRPQTLRAWACKENGPLRPRRLMGRLLWDLAEIRRLLGVAA